jgi:uncharacterized protein YhfF
VIARTWRARATEEGLERYRRHFEERVVPALDGIEGFRHARLLAAASSDGLREILVITEWDDMAAIRRFAGDEPSRAVVEPEAADALTDFDADVTHHEVLVDRPAPAVPRWGFAYPGALRDKLTELALDGTKTMTTSLLVDYAMDPDVLPRQGERQLLVDSEERPVAIVETVEIRTMRLADVDDETAIAEGEGFADAATFREAHERFWSGSIAEIRERIGDPAFDITDDTLVVTERFRVVQRLP